MNIIKRLIIFRLNHNDNKLCTNIGILDNFFNWKRLIQLGDLITNTDPTFKFPRKWIITIMEKLTSCYMHNLLFMN